MVEPAITVCGPGLTVVLADNAGPMTLDGTRSYLVGSSRLALIDPGPNEAGHLSRLVTVVAGRPVVAVLLTHAHTDHSGLARDAAREFGAPILASAETLDRTGLEGGAVTDGQRTSPGADLHLVAFFSPGHSADHVTYFSETERWLFTGDLVLGAGSSAILHPDGSVKACLASLSRLHALRPSRLLPGHGPPVDDAMGQLAAYRAHRLEREQQIVRALEAGAENVREIRAAVYDPLPTGLEWAAEASIAAHLAALAESGHDVPPFGAYGAATEQG
jgi:glyoxylase-like metal-dependent hydrolase (beta-lactamase superfamily II)